ncbi:hypothetical protein ACFFK8_13495 [Hallella seregens ATCC 51272]|uniref:Uncharacterized protein n=1 Tax=Hallella seregens ATCC 51272 TaxID=1336250 RepID=A0ABV5ZRK9_9BACT
MPIELTDKIQAGKPLYEAIALGRQTMKDWGRKELECYINYARLADKEIFSLLDTNYNQLATKPTIFLYLWKKGYTDTDISRIRRQQRQLSVAKSQPPYPDLSLHPFPAPFFSLDTFLLFIFLPDHCLSFPYPIYLSDISPIPPDPFYPYPCSSLRVPFHPLFSVKIS